MNMVATYMQGFTEKEEVQEVMVKFMNDKLTEDDEVTSTKLWGLLLEK